MTAEEVLERYAAGERDFSKAGLRQLKLRNVDLSGINLSGANLESAESIDINSGKPILVELISWEIGLDLPI